MGLFSNATAAKESDTLKLSPAEAFTAVLTTAMAADGYASDEELRMLRDNLFSMQLFKPLDDEARLHMLERVLKLLENPGPEALLVEARSVLKAELRETAFAMAADMVTSDGCLADEEQSYLDRLRETLDIQQDMADLLITAMGVKNRG
ncbi:MAG: tellurite resistance TerB family protein [Cyanobacteria bacterium P01_D01_bin.73]